MALLSASQIKGAYAIIPTPSTLGADHWSAVDTVDAAETARITARLIDDGVDGIIALGTTGECATLTETEFAVAASAVCEGAAGRVPTFVGATTMGTHQTIERLKLVRDLGATGTMLGLPMWQPCTEDMALKFYASISEAFPDLSVMVYMNPGAFRFTFPASFWGRLVDVAPTVTSAKYAGRDVAIADCFAATRGRIKFLPMDTGFGAYAEQMPDLVDACWSTSASMGPAPTIAIVKAAAARDWTLVQTISKDIAYTMETFVPPNPADFPLFNIQLEKIRMNEAGYCAAGPIRPPYDVISDEYAERARTAGRRWVEIAKKYSA